MTRVSVVVATHDRPERLGALLTSLREQTLPRDDFEVVVVDDGSGHATAQVLARERHRGALRLRLLRHERTRGPAAARDAGWRAACGAVVAFTDDDCVAAADWLAAGLRAVSAHPGAFVQGRTDPAPEELHRAGPFSRTITVHECGPFFQTCNILYPRNLLERVGGFDDAFPLPGGEDTDLAWRAMEAGARAAYADDVRVWHAVNELGPLGKLRVAWRWREAHRVYARHPGFRRVNTTLRLFWKPTHLWLYRALLALAVPPRHAALRAWLVGPYLHALWARGRIEGGGLLLAPYFVAHDLVEAAACLHGSVRFRAVVL